MKRYICISILAMALIIGCDKNDDAQPVLKPNQSQEGVQDVEDTDLESGTESAPIFEAGFENENDQTRTFIDESVKLLWSADDEISVFYSDSFNRRYSFDGNTGDDRGPFSYEASTEVNKGSELTTNYAVYPYSNGTSIAEDGTISITLPAIQKYAPKSFGVGANAMVAVTKDKNELFLPFKNLCGYLKLKLYGDVTIKSITLQGENKEPIAGPATITAEYSKAPTLTMREAASSTITIDCGDGVTLGATEESAIEFWFVVPPTNFENGFTVSVMGIDGGECFSMTTKARSIERNAVLSMAAQVAEYTIPPTNVLWYTTTDGNVIDNPTADFGSSIISNTYENGRGTITFAENITTIPHEAFKDNTNLTSVRMPNSITSIGGYAFAGCTCLEYISLANTITSIGNYAFQDCTGEILIDCDIPDAEILNGSLIGTFEKSQFTKVVISDWVTRIGNKAFYGCSSITSITIPSSVTEIGSYAFSGCSSITSDIVIPSGVTKINDYTFYGCSSIPSLSLPSSVTEIGNYAFSGCGGELMVNCNIPDAEYGHYSQYKYGKFYNSKFTKVTIGEGVTKIGSYAFYDCSSITSITIPSSVTKIGSYAFSGCGSITSDIVIPSGVTKINDHTFYGCSSISSITIPSSVTEIGSYAFSGCGSIPSLTLPSSVTEIGSYAFENCGGELTVNCNIPDGNSYYEYGKFYNSKFTKVTIGEGVTKIGSYAFSGCSSITNITIPSSVTEIGSSAFENCGGELTVNCNIPDANYSQNTYGKFYNSKFTKVTIGEGVTKIGSCAFYDCSSITSITIPSSVTEIGSYAFYGCGGELTVNCNIPDVAFKNAKFTKVAIGEGVTKVGSYAFYGCSSITSITIPSSVTEIGSYAFDGCSSITSDIVIPSGVTKINDHTFYDCSSISSITIPSSVTEIGSYAFDGCGGELTVNCNIPDANYSSYNQNTYGKFYNSKFTKVTIGDGVTRIGSYAFYGCSSITSITIPNSVTEIGNKAFYDCSSITSITIPSSVTEIGSYAFSGCSSITSDIVIPSGVTKINDYTFYDCSSITSITIPSSVMEIGSYAFDGCSSITSITIPSSVTEIGYKAFADCNSLQEVYCKPITPPSLDSYAFSYNASGRTIYVPTESAEAYKSSWSSYANAIVGCTFTE